MVDENNTRKMIVNMPDGKNWGIVFSDKSSVRVFRTGNEYKLRASWQVPESYSEDPLSVMCGCPLQGRSHVHMEKKYFLTQCDEIVSAFIDAIDALTIRKAPNFGVAMRIGA